VSNNLPESISAFDWPLFSSFGKKVLIEFAVTAE